MYICLLKHNDEVRSLLEASELDSQPKKKAY